MTAAPTIQTERIILRPHRLDEFESYVALWADPVVTRFIGVRARTREETWTRLLRNPGMWSMLGYGLWAIEEKATGMLIGEAGFQEVKRDITPSFEGTPEAGWVLLPVAHGRGIASEVVHRIHQWADGRPGFEKTVCIIEPNNHASLAIAKKLGYREKVRTTYHDSPTILFER